MSNPFEDENAAYVVLINDELQHSLWPVIVDVPDGWHVVFGEAPKAACLDYVDQHWTDMRPKSLVDAMSAAAGAEDRTG
ncbi:MbtH family NRPS accessory protein [Streptomyces sp. NPDC005955]|uniref:MbtH family protein n=1 Tax=Streptomyces sp. NPDC005955 TaxID=3364738 RepID=UPI003679CC5A